MTAEQSTGSGSVMIALMNGGAGPPLCGCHHDSLLSRSTAGIQENSSTAGIGVAQVISLAKWQADYQSPLYPYHKPCSTGTHEERGTRLTLPLVG